MPKTFPISINGQRFSTARALAKDIAHRGEQRVLPDRGCGHPSAHYRRWMEADPSGRTRDAVLEACALLIDRADTSGDAFDHAVDLIGSAGSEAVTLRILQRVDAGDIPDSRWFGAGPEIALRALVAVTHAVETRLPTQRARLAALLERHGASYRAATLLLGSGDPAVVSLVRRWADRAPIPGDEARILARRARRHPPLVVPLAAALRPASDAARRAFQAAIDRHQPDRSADVAAALSGDGASVRFCRGGGLLATPRTPMPTDPGDFYGEGRLDLVPCAALTCSACRSPVRHIDGRIIPDDVDLNAIFSLPSWQQTPLLTDTARSCRAYACRCSVANIVTDTLIDDVGGSWSCAGHPALQGVLVLDGVTVGTVGEAEAAVARALGGDAPEPWAGHGAVWVLRLCGRLRGHPLSAVVGEAVGRALLSGSIGARSEALTFFLQHPFGPGSDMLPRIARDHRDLLAGVVGPDTAEGETLEHTLLRILGMRLEQALAAGRAPDVGALALLREASAVDGLAGATLPCLSAVDTAWVVKNRLAIAAGSRSNARAVSLWIGINAAGHEAETDALLVSAGLLDA